MRKRLLSFIAAAGMLFAGAGTAWADTETVTAGYTIADVTKTDITLSPENNANLSVSTIQGSASVKGSGDKTCYFSSTSNSKTNGAICYRSYKSSTASKSDDVYFGFKATVASRYLYSLSNVTIRLGVSETFSWNVTISNEAGGVLYTSGDKSTKKTTSDNPTLSVDLSSVAAVQGLSGNIYVKCYYWLNNDSKYITADNFTIKGTLEKNNAVVVSATTDYDYTEGKYLVTLASDPEDATITYKVGDSDEAITYNDSFLADPESTVKVSATSDGLTPVTDQVVTIPAMPAAPAATYAEEYDGSKEQYLVTLTGASSYQIGDGAKTAYTAPFYADPKASITAYATKTNYAESSTVFTVSAKPTVATPEVTVTQHVVYRNYEISISCATDGAALTYALGDNASQEYSGAFIVNPETKVTVTATKLGYTSSNYVVTPKAYPTENPYTETTPTPADKNITQSGYSYSIDGTSYIAGAGSSQGTDRDWSPYIKMRMTLNSAGSYKNGFRIAVTEGYTITKIVMRGCTNQKSTDKDPTQSVIDAVSVDGVAVSDFTKVTLGYSDKAKTSETAFELTDISAKSAIDFSCSGNSQAQLQFDITFTMPDQIIPVTLDETVGYATYYSDKALKFNADDVTVYTGAINGTSLVLSEVKDAIPAKTAVILKGDAGKEVEFTVTSDEVTAIDGINDLKGVTEATALENVYVLSYKTGLEDVGFYKAASVTVPANKAYVEWPAEATAAEAPVLRFNFGETDEPGNVTGISAVAIENNAQQVIYDLRGRRVQSFDRPGLYIVNGKKVAVQ